MQNLNTLNYNRQQSRASVCINMLNSTVISKYIYTSICTHLNYTKLKSRISISLWLVVSKLGILDISYQLSYQPNSTDFIGSVSYRVPHIPYTICDIYYFFFFNPKRQGGTLCVSVRRKLTEHKHFGQ